MRPRDRLGFQAMHNGVVDQPATEEPVVRLVTEGEVALQIATDRSRETHVATFGRGDFFGTLDTGAVQASVLPTMRAITDVRLFALDEAGLKTIEQVAPEFGRALRSELRSRQRTWVEALSSVVA